MSGATLTLSLASGGAGMLIGSGGALSRADDNWRTGAARGAADNMAASQRKVSGTGSGTAETAGAAAGAGAMIELPSGIPEPCGIKAGARSGISPPAVCSG